METTTCERYATHEVLNQPRPLENYNVYASDAALREGVSRGGGDWALDALTHLGEVAGRSEVIRLGELANRHVPELKTHDRYGYRQDEVEYHPAWHELMALSVAEEIHALPWNTDCEGAHVVRAARHYLMTQVEAGHLCPITMTFAAYPALEVQPEILAEWGPRIRSKQYDPRFRPAPEKAGCIMGMFMTEKQGGSDVRANTTRAVPLGAEGPGQDYYITGHKWFCSAPMSDAFLMLAQTGRGLSCFIVPRWLPDGTRNRLYIQRLKNKLGNRSNASSEIEFVDTWGRMVGEEGRGVRTIIEMVNHTRLDCVIGAAGVMRQALAQALNHCRGRAAFGKLLKDQPLMKNVLADLALESEAATALAMRLAAGYDRTRSDAKEGAFVRIATAIGKYWVCKRCPGMVYEALECHGGAGYVEESIMPRLYREAPLGSIWEGSGNVLCLDVLRAMAREPESLPVLLDELRGAKGANAHYDHHLHKLEHELHRAEHFETRARRVVEMTALALQAAQLLRFAPGYVSDAFCAARLSLQAGHEYGTLEVDGDFDAILRRAMPAV
jgi:putative acyl-CoA dehydrogenase